MVNRLSSSFPKGGHSASLTSLFKIYSRYIEDANSTETDITSRKQAYVIINNISRL